ncbi:neuropeptides capa receptor-like [Physella acuta]|uniref:neuropeptides capa receptor-like n=1 Tax=Physella acuta TaxID=109671 RepID=UPI0027DC6A01|nr:neuropeptides capa receptor-like [Physella acuta]
MECNVSTNPNVSRNYTEEEKACYLAHLQLYSTYTMIPTIIYLVVLCVAGIIGNSIVLFVYSQRFRSTASGTFIMAIAVFDLMANLVLIPGDIYGMFHHWDFDMVYLCKLRSYGHAVTHGASSFFLVALAVTRYRKICKPFHKQVSIQQANNFCIGVTFLEIAISILYFITQGIQKKKTPNQNIFGYVCSVDDKFNGTYTPLEKYKQTKTLKQHEKE